MSNASVAPANRDDDVEVEIARCLDLSKPKSFFLYAGAGSGKTRSLVAAVRFVLETSRRSLQLSNKRIAVVTYTNAAAKEITRRLEFDPLVEVSTINSFAWKLIAGFQADIREWLRTRIAAELSDLNSKSSKPGTKAESDRLYRIERNTRRLNSLDDIVQFVYNPNGDNRTRDSLNHSEVISIAAFFLDSKPLMASVLASGYP